MEHVKVDLPLEQSTPLEAPPVLRRLQAEDDIHRVRTRVGDEAWLVTGFGRTQQLLGDPRLGRSHPDPSKAARMSQSALFGGPVGNFETESTDNARLHEILRPEFSPKRMRALRPRIEALTVGLLDTIAGQNPPVDLIQALALPLPILVICEMLGVPYEDREAFRAWTDAAGNVTSRAVSERGLAQLFAYGLQLVDRKRMQPADDFISGLCRQGVPEQRVAQLAMLMLFAGHETTVVAIGMGVLNLLTHSEQLQALLDDPTLIAAAVEEMLRAQTTSGADGIPRYAREDMKIDGAIVRAGDLVILDTGAANHDASVFAHPHRFDVRRHIDQHLAFGFGPHYCIGAPLARLELRAVFEQLLPRFPTLRLAVPVQELKTHRNKLTGGLIELPVTW